MIMEFVFEQQYAMAADQGGYISEKGVYEGVLTKAELFTTQNGAKGVEFAFESSSGEKADYMKIYTRKNNGEISFGYGIVQSLLGLLNLKKVNIVLNGEKNTMPELCYKPIVVALQKEEYVKSDGGVGYKMNILHFFDPKTRQTYSEKVAGKPAAVVNREIKDKLLDISFETAKNVTQTANYNDLPF